MNEKPILFSAPMVRAILAGRKTQTRRSVKPGGCSCPYGKPGGRLWVRTSWWKFVTDQEANEQAWDEFTRIIRWKSGEECRDCEPGDKARFWRKMPSIHMPRWACRIMLEITGVRAEPLAYITRDDALAEGILYDENLDGYCYDEDGRGYHASSPVRAYENLWRSINGPGSWESNPWVWVITFKRIEP